MVSPWQSLVRLRLVPLPTGIVNGAVNFTVPQPSLKIKLPMTCQKLDASTKLPSGVAGQFNASSTYTSVVGAFAAEKQ